MHLADILFTQGHGTRRVCAGLIEQGLVHVYQDKSAVVQVFTVQAAMKLIVISPTTTPALDQLIAHVRTQGGLCTMAQGSHQKEPATVHFSEDYAHVTFR